MSGPEVAEKLRALAEHFPVPVHGRYVDEPARTDENGIVSLPPPAPDSLPRVAAGIAIGAAAGLAIAAAARRRGGEQG
jgi:hypothetical protein